MTRRGLALPMLTISDSNRSSSSPPQLPSAVGRHALDAVLVLGCAGLLWAMASRSLLVEAVAVGTCVVAAAAALARVDVEARRAVASAGACSALAITVLISDPDIWSPNRPVAAMFMLLAAVGIANSGPDASNLDRHSIYAVVGASIGLGPLWSLWGGDDGVSTTNALRLLAAVVAMSGSLRVRRHGQWLAADLGVAAAAVLGTTWLERQDAELVAMAGVGLLVLHHWWRGDGSVVAPDRSR